MEKIDRINKIDRTLLQQMTGQEVIPEPVLDGYFAVKRIVDKAGGNIHPSVMAMIVLQCGVIPEAGNNPVIESGNSFKNPVSGNGAKEDDESKEDDSEDIVSLKKGSKVNVYSKGSGQIISGEIVSSEVQAGQIIYMVDTEESEEPEEYTEDEIIEV